MHKKLMIVGPTEIEDDILTLGKEPQVYMRTPEFSARLEKIFKNLQYLFQTKNPVVFYASSGTGMLDAAVNNFLSPKDEIIVINGGSFGQRWVDIASRYGIIVHEIKVDFGKSVTEQQVKEALLNYPKAKALYTTLDETSSGAKTDLKTIGSLLQDYPHILYVSDCVSALGVEPMKMDEWGLDVVISASQKALAIPPGLGFMAVSSKAVNFAQKSTLRSFYFDILEYLKDWKRNQTPFTPAVSLIFQLEKRLEKIVAEGLDNFQKRYFLLTEKVRTSIKKLGFDVLAEHPANCVTAIKTDEYDASEIVRIMSQKYNIELAPSGGALKQRLFRIGNFGNITEKDIDEMATALEKTLEELKND